VDYIIATRGYDFRKGQEAATNGFKLGSVRDRPERDFEQPDAGGLVPLGKLTVATAHAARKMMNAAASKE
jgi:hypothetical protein